MKLTQRTQAKRKPGMTLLELTVVILVLLSLISILFVGARAWKKGSDRSANIMNMRNCQQAMRGHQNMYNLNPAAPFTDVMLIDYMRFPANIGTAVTYTAGTVITAMAAEPPANDAHLWLRPSAAGSPGTAAEPTDYGPLLIDTAGW